MYTRKSLFELWVLFWTKSKFGFRTFFDYVSERNKVPFEEKLSPGVLDLFAFSKKIIFRFSKRCSEAWEQYFWDFWVRTEENKSVKEFVCFSTTDVFVPVSQLSTRDLFYFLGNLKIKQDFLSRISFLVWSLDQRALWFPYSRLFFFGIVFKKMLFPEYLGCFTKSIVVSILDFWHISFRKMFELLTCKRNHNFWVSGIMWRTLLFKRIRDMASLWDVIRHFSGWGFYVAFATTTLVACSLI